MPVRQTALHIEYPLISRNFETARNFEIVDVMMNFSAVNTNFRNTCNFEIT
jgi:hypothetical protein